MGKFILPKGQQMVQGFPVNKFALKGEAGNGTVNTDGTLTGDGSIGSPLGLNLSNTNTWTVEQGNTSIFRNNSGTDWTTNNVTIAAAGTDGIGAWIGFQWNHTDDKVYLQDEGGALYDLSVDTLYANDSIISSQVSANQFTGSTFTAFGSGGLLFESNSGTDVALFGAGGGSNATFYGGVNIAGNLAVDTDILYVETTNDFVAIGGTSRIGSLGKFNLFGTGSSIASPLLAIKHTDDTSTGKNGGIWTETRMTNRYLRTTQNLGFNDNSFGNAGVIQWTAWEYTDNGYTTLATPTEFTGWSYQYWNGSAYQNLLRVHTSGIYIGASSASVIPQAALHLNRTTAVAVGMKITNSSTGVASGDGTDIRISSTGVLQIVQNESQNITVSIAGTTRTTWSTGGAGDLTHDGTFILTRNAITTTDTYGISAQNQTSATVGVPRQQPPIFSQIGHVWDTGASATRVIGFSMAQTYTSGNPGTGVLRWGYQYNTSASFVATGFSTLMNLSSSGYLAIGNGTTAGTALLDVAASSTARASARLREGTAPTSPNEGDVWNDSTQKALIVYVDGVKQNLDTTLFTQTASVTVANTVTQTTLTSTGIGTLTLPANFFVAGKTIQVAGFGYDSSSGNPTIRVRIKLGSTTILDTGAITSGNSSNNAFVIDGIITCRTTGATGTVIGQGYFEEVHGTGATGGMVNTATTTIDTTASQTVDVTVEWGTASASNTITLTNLILKVLN